MHSQILRVLELEADDSLAIGHQHGETYRREIGELASIRMERMRISSHFKKTKDILELAHKHIRPLYDFDKELFLELKGISDASNVSLEHLIVLNHYTDLRDIMPNAHHDLSKDSDATEANSGCSIIYSPTHNGPVLGQTWDIHGSAQPYIIMLKVKDCLAFSIVGCLGMMGLNKHGVGVAINNLSSFDARIGVLWPALVRKILMCKNAQSAKEEIMKCPSSSGRHYAVVDENNFFGIELSGTKKKIICDDASKKYFHTNHCLDAEMRKTHMIRKGSNTLWRLEHLQGVIGHEDLSSPKKVFLALRSVSIAPDKNYPHKTTTCGTVVMDINQRSTIACSGIAHEELLEDANYSISL
ncbi:MAG: hypothetical protein KC505_03145 [Myxococcales bacterium]|nr:hypothetical protein [Myxococcales bacterium]USN50122.1 MAG: hypothetical protein H6731_07575 [Myxococcales bacterium]